MMLRGLATATAAVAVALAGGASAQAAIPQSVAFPQPADHILGEADFAPGATASSGLPVSYSSQTTGACTIVVGKVHLVAAGTCTIAAEQTGDAEYAAATPAQRSFQVASRARTVGAVIAAGREFSCALTGAGQAGCWGENHWGQLGDGNSDVEQNRTPVEVQGLSGAFGITAGDRHTCALTEPGQDWCWGYNGSGQLGDGTEIERDVPTEIHGLSGATAIDGGNSQTCALTGSGEGRCWGWNFFGQLGNGTTHSSFLPVAVEGLTGATSISAGEVHTCAVTAAETVACWGWNGIGQLGDGTTENRSVPVAVEGLSGVIAVSAGANSTCAITRSGKAWCWGGNVRGQLGDGTEVEESDVPVEVSGLGGLTAIAVGQEFACALTGAGKAWCWGAGEIGQLGDGTTEDSNVPVELSGLGGLTAIATGDRHACAMSGAGAVYCWGLNLYGQLGDGSGENVSLTPVRTQFQTRSQTIDFPTIGTRIVGEADFDPGASASSNLSVAYDLLTPAVCTVVAGKVHLVATGQCTIVAEQPGDVEYEAAAAVERSFQVKMTQSITFSQPADHALGEADFDPGASASSSLAVAYASSTESVCTIVAGKVHLVAAGECRITAEQSGNVEYEPATPVERSFTVAKESQTISFVQPANKIVGEADFDPGATASSGLSVAYSSQTTSVCTVVSGKVHIVTAGECKVTAEQTGDAEYEAASPVQRSITIAKATQTITFAALRDRTYGEADFELTAETSSGLAVGFTSQTEAVCRILTGRVHLVSAGTCTIAADQEGDGSYESAPQILRSFDVAKASTSVTLGLSPSSGVLPGQSIQLVASVAGVAPVGAVAFMEGERELGQAVVGPGGQARITLTSLSPGVHQITARYSGDAGNATSASPTVTVTVEPLPSPSITHSPNSPHTPNPMGGPRWTFVFNDQAPGATFYCRLDKAPFKPCHSPRVYRNLKRGRHVFRLKSIDAAGNESSLQVIQFFAGSRHSKH